MGGRETRSGGGALRVLHLIDSLAPGGAQRQLVTLLAALDRSEVEASVAVYHRLDHFKPEVEASGAPIHELGGSGGRDPRVTIRLARLMAGGRYDVVHSWLRTPGVLARVAAMLSHGPPVIVSERNVDLGRSARSVALERVLARRARFMIVNAEAIGRGVERFVPAWKGRIRVVHNGLRFIEPSERDLEHARSFRREHVAETEMLLGVVGRIEAQKAPLLLLDALERLPRDIAARVKVVWVGKEIDAGLAGAVRARARSPRLEGRFELVPETREIRSVYIAMDGLVLASRWEGLPNVVLEALGNGRPAIATDVGDTSKLVSTGSTGWLVPPDDPEALARAIAEFVRSSPSRLREIGERGARLVRDEYSDTRLAEGTVAVYREALE